jgi:hypothetical protein
VSKDVLCAGCEHGIDFDGREAGRVENLDRPAEP